MKIGRHTFRDTPAWVLSQLSSVGGLVAVCKGCHGLAVIWWVISTAFLTYWWFVNRAKIRELIEELEDGG